MNTAARVGEQGKRREANGDERSVWVVCATPHWSRANAEKPPRVALLLPHGWVRGQGLGGKGFG